MELLKHQKDKMQVVKKLLLFVLIITLNSCNAQKNNNNKKNYIITKYKSKDKSSCYINLEAFEFENKKNRFYSVYHINNLIFSDHDLKALNENVLKGEFKINAGAVGKEWIRVPKFILKKGDSINIRFYLKDSDEVYDQLVMPKN
ncbi:hypothetical protein KCTC32516_01038 [Polaribacter huanghezhanensis]|uniref:hypothetical protein n=1 Tax=Polaribacter huanghezhanensis TaxID=1354726 RepID=UPI00264A1E19|nr:hypothetical protein [Polaribacter huanghezhanensis]WKD85693.1 hypothetical protein KCTC32516_01038 [Polaribacter huanghezhanensis]